MPNLSARETSRAPASPERRERPPLDQSSQDRSYGYGSPDFGGGVGVHDDDTYHRGPIPENARSPTRDAHTHTPQIPPENNIRKGCSLQSMEPLREWLCKGADVTSPAEQYEAALCQLEEDPPDIRQVNVNIREEEMDTFVLGGCEVSHDYGRCDSERRSTGYLRERSYRSLSPNIASRSSVHPRVARWS